MCTAPGTAPPPGQKNCAQLPSPHQPYQEPWHSLVQVAALHKQFPEAIATGYMDFLEGPVEEEAAAGEGAAAGGVVIEAAAAAAAGMPAAEQQVQQQQAQHGAAAQQAAAGAPQSPADRVPGPGGEAAAPVPALPQITFLYRLTPGVAPRSFGLNVARMAHLPLRVVQRAAVLAAELEAADRRRRGKRRLGQQPLQPPQLQEGQEQERGVGAAPAADGGPAVAAEGMEGMEQQGGGGEVGPELVSKAQQVLREVGQLLGGEGGLSREALQRLRALSRAAAGE